MSSIEEWDIVEDNAGLAVNAQAPLIIDNVEQGTDDWHSLRVGHITGSKASHMMAGGTGKTRDKYLLQLAIERLTGKVVMSSFKSKPMMKGNEDEPLAREHYEFINDADVRQVAFVLHPLIPMAGVSPDGLIGEDGVLEIKCPNLETHVEYLLTRKIPGNYMTQVQWELACTGRQYCDWMTYCKEMPIHLRSMIIRVHRDESRISALESAAVQFNKEIEQLIIKLEAMK